MVFVKPGWKEPFSDIGETDTVPGFFQRLFRKSSKSSQSKFADSSADQPTQPLPSQLAETAAETTAVEKTAVVKTQAETTPVVNSQLEKTEGDESLLPPQIEPPQLSVGIGHSAGRQREDNEDSLFSLTSTLISNETYLPFGLFIVADGMGGHEHGEIASGIAVRAMASLVINEVYSPQISLSPTKSTASLPEIMRKGIQAAHLAIIKHAPGGGTTLTGVLILGDQMTIAHVGDSRAYTIHSEGRIQVLTRDHSLVKRLVELARSRPPKRLHILNAMSFTASWVRRTDRR
jgi:hypothetical protein